MENRAFYPNHLRNASVYCGERLINSGDGRLEKDKREAKTSLRDKTVGGYRNRNVREKGVMEGHRNRERERERDRRKGEMVVVVVVVVVQMSVTAQNLRTTDV